MKKDKEQRSSVPITPGYHHKKHGNTWLSIGSAIILISVVVAIIVGFWAFAFGLNISE